MHFFEQRNPLIKMIHVTFVEKKEEEREEDDEKETERKGMKKKSCLVLCSRGDIPFLLNSF